MAREVKDVEEEVADAELVALVQVLRGHARLDLKSVAVRAVQPIGIIRVNGERRIRGTHQRRVVEDMVDVPV
jgi:hypothetical protein